MFDDPLAQLRHDLANPLSAVMAETQLLLLNEAELAPDVVTSLKHIESLSRRMRDILQQQK